MRLSTAALFVCAASALALSMAAQTIQINRDNKTVAISATDEATAVADIAGVSVGFEVFEPDSERAYAEGGRLSHAILDALHKAGVKDDEIESGEQGLQRNTEFDEKATAEDRAKRQFMLRQSWTVSANPKAAPEIIRLAVAAGANKTGSIDWRLSDRKALQAKAAENALVKAHAIADRMAEGLHVKLGALIYASNETPAAKLYFADGTGSGGGGAASYMVAPKEPMRDLEIRPQTVREEATVYAVFAIE